MGKKNALARTFYAKALTIILHSSPLSSSHFENRLSRERTTRPSYSWLATLMLSLPDNRGLVLMLMTVILGVYMFFYYFS